MLPYSAAVALVSAVFVSKAVCVRVCVFVHGACKHDQPTTGISIKHMIPQ